MSSSSPVIQQRTALLVGTRKGAFIYEGEGRQWRCNGPYFLGSAVNHLVLDPRDGETLLAAVKAGHLGPTVYCSGDRGASWREAKRPPAFKKAPEGDAGRTVDHVFWLSPGHSSQPGVWYAGMSPVGLFRSSDGGESWEEVAGFNDGLYPRIQHKVESPPDGSILHSILIDPRDARRLYVGLSTGGVFESPDGGESWRALNRGVEAYFLPEKDPEFGHDPHLLALHPLKPDRLYQQNHCGVYRLDRPGEQWQRIGARIPKEIGDIGFPLALHPRDPDTLWIVPMDGTDVWPRTSPGGRPAVYRSRDGGGSWERQDQGLPAENAWFTVKRQAFCADARDPVGLYFGTTGGEIWASADEGQSWAQIAAHLPEIYSLVAVGAARP
ncbi:MAG TPA: glycosyl hydrolase [Burkholderiales bacterium]|nr:glycosyl hydrolase [Burkholderiales bacterium]